MNSNAKAQAKNAEVFSFFTDANATKASGRGTIIDLVSKIMSNPPGWKKKVDKVRQLTGKAKQNAKNELPAMTTSIEITRPDGKRKNLKDGDFTHTGLIQADFDDHPDYPKLIAQLKCDKHARGVFKSPSEKAKAFFKVAECKTIRDHQSAFGAVSDYCERMGYGVIDASCKDIARLCFISDDPKALLNVARKALLSADYSDSTRSNPHGHWDGGRVGVEKVENPTPTTPTLPLA